MDVVVAVVALAAFVAVVPVTLSFAQDSRGAVRSQEQDLAAFGVTWATDTAHEAALAQELRAAQRRRLANPPAAAGPPATPTEHRLLAPRSLRVALTGE